MIEWSEQHRMIRDAVRKFVEAEIAPNLDALEHGDMPPYDILRKMFATFGMDALAKSRFERMLQRERGDGSGKAEPSGAADDEMGDRGDSVAM